MAQSIRLLRGGAKLASLDEKLPTNDKRAEQDEWVSGLLGSLNVGRYLHQAFIGGIGAIQDCATGAIHIHRRRWIAKTMSHRESVIQQ